MPHTSHWGRWILLYLLDIPRLWNSEHNPALPCPTHTLYHHLQWEGKGEVGYGGKGGRWDTVGRGQVGIWWEGSEVGYGGKRVRWDQPPTKSKITSYRSVIMHVTQLKARFSNVWGKHYANLKEQHCFSSNGRVHPRRRMWTTWWQCRTHFQLTACERRQGWMQHLGHSRSSSDQPPTAWSMPRQHSCIG